MKSLLEIQNLFRKTQSMEWPASATAHPSNRGIPLPKKGIQCKECNVCEKSCPTEAIQVKNPITLQFDYGKCIQCGECVRECPTNQLQSSGFTYVFSRDREALVVTFQKGDFEPKAERDLTDQEKEFQKLSQRSGFLYREVAAGGNNSVECELNASFNSVFDSEREGVRSVASPKHADAIVFSGPVPKNMETPLQTAWDVMPEPKALIACGTEAVSGGLFPLGKLPSEPNLFIGGDPPRPDVMLQAFRYLMGRISFSFQKALHHFHSQEREWT